MNKVASDLDQQTVAEPLPPRDAESRPSETIPRPSHPTHGERRRVTVLFADVMGFTAMSEKLDPEDVFHTMNRCFDRLGRVITRYEGTIDKFIGDCVMALFGAPIAHENDPERAVRAALEMQQELTAFSLELQEQTQLTVRMRIGINSGMVIAGGVGSDDSRQYTVMGDAVNLANRIESAARPGGVLVSESVYRQTNRYFQFEAWEPIRVKGKEQPVAVYEVASAKRKVAGGDVGRQRSVFVGRDLEVRVLREALGQLESGCGGIVNIVGEAGIGKSRLLEEFIAGLEDSGAFSLSALCHPNENSIAYQTWRNLLSQLCGIESADSEERRNDKVSESLSAIAPGLTEWVPRLADILGLAASAGAEPEDAGRDTMTAKRVTQQAVRNVVVSLANKHGLILVIDDLQWADPLSQELLALLISDLPTSRILLLTARRPGTASQWLQEAESADLQLPPLTEEESTQMLSVLLGASHIPDKLGEMVVERSSGNPLFIEELLRALVESDALKKDEGQWQVTEDVQRLQLPETLEAVVTSRIDRLSPGAKQALTCAAVVGRNFSIGVLREVARLNDDFLPVLSELEQGEFIEEISPAPNWEYRFQQAIFQEVAYQMLLLERRRQYHDTVGKALEGLHRDHLEDQYESLAFHYGRSDNRLKAFDYSLRAGDKAMRLFSTADARNFLAEALGSFGELSPAEREEWSAEELRCHQLLGDVATLTGDYPDALREYRHVLEVLYARPTTREPLESSPANALPAAPASDIQAASLKRRIGNVYSRQAEFAESVRWLREALSLVSDEESHAHRHEAARIWGELASVSLRMGRYPEATDQASQGLHLAEQVEGRKVISDCCLILGVIRHGEGDYAAAENFLHRSLQIREELGDLVGIASALNNLGNLCSDRGGYEEAEEFFRRSFEMRAKIGHTEGMSATLVNRGNVAFNLGRYDGASQHYQQALALAERIGNAHTVAIARLNLGRTQLCQRDKKKALATLSTALEDAERHGFQDVLALFHAELAVVWIMEGDARAGEEHGSRSREIAEEIGSNYHRAFAARSLGTVCMGLRQPERAIAYLQESLQLFEAMNADHEVARTCIELIKVEQGSTRQALRDRAKIILERLQAAGDLQQLAAAEEDLAR